MKEEELGISRDTGFKERYDVMRLLTNIDLIDGGFPAASAHDLLDRHSTQVEISGTTSSKGVGGEQG